MPKKKSVDYTPEEILNNYVLGRKEPVGGEALEPSKTAMFIDFNMRLSKLPMVELTDRKAVHKRIDEYFDLCREYHTKPTVEGLSLSYRIHRTNFLRIARGENKNVPKWLSDEFGFALQILNSLWADYTLNGQINPVSSIFTAKNNFEYRDQQDIVLTPGQVEEEIPEAELIEEAKLLGD